MTPASPRFYFIILSILEIISVYSDEIKDNSVTITIVDITTNTWTNEGKAANFTRAIATVANDYCSSNYEKCGLKFWNSTRVFKAEHVKISSGYPKQDGDNIYVEFYIKLPSGADIRRNLTNLLPASAIKTIFSLKQNTLSSLIGVELKMKENATTKPTVDNKMNVIMIPISFGLVLALVLLACGLQYCHKRKMEEIKAAERRQYASKERAAMANSQSPFLVTSTGIPQVAVKPQRRDDLSTQVYNEDETKKNSKTQQNSETDARSPPRRKKKTKKRKSHKENDVDDEDNGHVNKGIINDDESDQERSTPKERRKRKTHSENRHSDDEAESEQEEVAEEAAKSSDNILSKLPSPKPKESEDRRNKDQSIQDESDEERIPTKDRKRRKKRHKKKVESTSPLSQDDDESEQEHGETAETVESDDILSRLPPPRKLPPLRA